MLTAKHFTTVSPMQSKEVFINLMVALSSKSAPEMTTDNRSLQRLPHPCGINLGGQETSMSAEWWGCKLMVPAQSSGFTCCLCGVSLRVHPACPNSIQHTTVYSKGDRMHSKHGQFLSVLLMDTIPKNATQRGNGVAAQLEMSKQMREAC